MAITKIEGVSSVQVSLNDGMTIVHLARTNSVRIEQIREAIRSNGFTPKDADVRVAGALVQRGDTLALAVPGAEEILVLQDFPGAPAQLGALRQLGPNARVTLSGQVPASERRDAASRVLLVRSFAAGDGEPEP